MGRLVLVRHAESEGNRDGVFTRTGEVPLTDVGRQQARVAAETVRRRCAVTGIVSSPFTRARQTADILASILVVPVRIEADLRERSYGQLAGLPYAAARECADYDPATYWRWCPPGGETLVEVAARAGAVLDRIAGAVPDEDVAVVTHGAVLMAIRWHVTGSWNERRVVPNAGIVLVEHHDGRWLGAEPLEER